MSKRLTSLSTTPASCGYLKRKLRMGTRSRFKSIIWVIFFWPIYFWNGWISRQGSSTYLAWLMVGVSKTKIVFLWLWVSLAKKSVSEFECLHYFDRLQFHEKNYSSFIIFKFFNFRIEKDNLEWRGLSNRPKSPKGWRSHSALWRSTQV